MYKISDFYYFPYIEALLFFNFFYIYLKKKKYIKFSKKK
jgi:hypothetical protein